MPLFPGQSHFPSRIEIILSSVKYGYIFFCQAEGSFWSKLIPKMTRLLEIAVMSLCPGHSSARLRYLGLKKRTTKFMFKEITTREPLAIAFCGRANFLFSDFASQLPFETPNLGRNKSRSRSRAFPVHCKSVTRQQSFYVGSGAIIMTEAYRPFLSHTRSMPSYLILTTALHYPRLHTGYVYTPYWYQYSRPAHEQR